MNWFTAKYAEPLQLRTTAKPCASDVSSVPEFEASLRRYIANYNKNAKPFTWTKGADYLLGKK